MTEPTNLGTQSARAIVDNGSFGTREVVFSTGRLARQAAGSAIAQLGETVVVFGPEGRLAVAHEDDLAHQPRGARNCAASIFSTAWFQSAEADHRKR